MTDLRMSGETGYLNLLEDVRRYGERRANRTGQDTLSLFGPQLRFDLTEGFPLFTTKRVWWKGVAVEIDWMLQGTGHIAYLQEHGVKIWDAWAKSDFRPEMGYVDGALGPVYGVQWRRWPVFYWRDDLPQGRVSGQLGEIDQIAQIVAQLRRRATGEIHSDDRRILLNSWNVADVPKMKLPPCHYGAQFLVDNALGLTTIVSIRSWDLFLGGPFNVAQYALLTYLLAHVCGLRPKTLIMNAGDAHIYVNHLEQVDEQLTRTPTEPPSLAIDPSVREIGDFRWDLALLTNYHPQAAIKGDVAI